VLAPLLLLLLPLLLLLLPLLLVLLLLLPLLLLLVLEPVAVLAPEDEASLPPQADRAASTGSIADSVTARTTAVIKSTLAYHCIAVDGEGLVPTESALAGELSATRAFAATCRARYLR
jgi:hypothetical protein